MLFYIVLLVNAPWVFGGVFVSEQDKRETLMSRNQSDILKITYTSTQTAKTRPTGKKMFQNW